MTIREASQCNPVSPTVSEGSVVIRAEALPHDLTSTQHSIALGRISTEWLARPILSLFVRKRFHPLRDRRQVSILNLSTQTFFHDLLQVTLPQPHTNTADNQNDRKADEINVHGGSAQIIALTN